MIVLSYSKFFLACIAVSIFPAYINDINTHSCLLLISVFLIFIFIRYHRFIEQINESKFVFLVFGSAFILSCISIVFLGSQAASDFDRMNALAMNISEHFGWSYLKTHVLLSVNSSSLKEWIAVLPWVPREYNHFTRLYADRILFYLFPIYTLFGNHFFLIKMINVIFHLSTGFFFYKTIQKFSVSRTISRLSIIYFFLLPIGYLNLNLPSHDIPGLFFLSLSLYIFSRLLSLPKNQHIKQTLLAVIVGIILGITDIQRGYGIIFLVLIPLIGITSLFQIERKNLYSISIVILHSVLIPLTCMYLCTHFFKASKHDGEIHEIIFSYNDPQGSGSYSDALRYQNQYLAQISDTERKRDLAIGRMMSNLVYEPKAYFFMLMRKAKILYSIGDDQYWALSNSNLNTKYFTLILDLSITARMFIFSLVILGSIFFIIQKNTSMIYILYILFWTILCLTFLVAVVQPRYSYPFHLTGSLLAAIGTERIFNFNKFNLIVNSQRLSSFLCSIFPSKKIVWLVLGIFSTIIIIAQQILTPYLFLDLQNTVKPDHTANQPHKNDTKTIPYIYTLPMTFEKPTFADFEIPLNDTYNSKFILQGFVSAVATDVQQIDFFIRGNEHPIHQILFQTKSSESMPQSTEQVMYFHTQPFKISTTSLQLQIMVTPETQEQKGKNSSQIFLEFLQMLPY